LRNSSIHGRAALLPARGAAVLTLVLLVVSWTGAAAAHSVPRAGVEPTQRLVALLSAHQVFSKPAASSTPLEVVQQLRPITGERTVLPVLADQAAADGVWLQVRLPGRPNSHTGWIRKGGTTASTTSWHIVVETSTRRVVVYQNGRPVRVVMAVVGKPSTPTPRGEFFVEEAVQLRSYDVGAPFALALSARSNVFQEFDGGPGQVALHGLANVGGVLGTAVSHGCVRLDGGTMSWLVLRIGPGVPVTIS
jgi:lipoprotein-anchoring transpeptidase ErfK/SrfK